MMADRSPSDHRRGLELVPGLLYYPDYLDLNAQVDLLRQVRDGLAAAPLFQPTMPNSGKPFSVTMSNCGPLGWMSDRNGYRYSATHPATGQAWPPIPLQALDAWSDLAAYPRLPEACLVNYYAPDARMGLHQDRDEAGFVAPVLSLSLGDHLRVPLRWHRAPGSNPKLEAEVRRCGSSSAGAARLAFHGVDRIVGGSSNLLAEGGRFNLTLRRVSAEPFDEGGRRTVSLGAVEPPLRSWGPPRDTPTLAARRVRSPIW